MGWGKLMKIFVSGGTGFIGGHLLRRLLEDGHEITALVHDKSMGVLSALPNQLHVVRGEWSRPADWLPHVRGHEAVINCVGIIRENKRGSFDVVHHRSAVALFEAAVNYGVENVIQVSALGADQKAETRYHKSKKKADDQLAKLGVPYTVLRPSIVYGPGDHSMKLFLTLASLPVIPVPGDGKYLVQPVYVGDVVRAVGQALKISPSQAVDMGGGDQMQFQKMMERLAHHLGVKHPHFGHIPWALMQAASGLTDMTSGLGPISNEELSMLRRGNFCDNSEFVRIFGFQPVGLEEGLKLRNAESSVNHN